MPLILAADMSSSEQSSHRLFVYGTLKRGFCRHPAIASEHFLGTARTAPDYRMVNLGTYPGLLDAGESSGRSIHGEVWEVSPEALARLDVVEGIAEGEYIRREIQLLYNEFGRVEAYFYLQNTDGCPDCGENWL
ncbi:MAG TPA: gamma-glutamylcyclotransferase family protein [Planctomicrobium sp.]|nr:gamma-glutamylcyclotransferase family protein [Planctomicrobium sp.]